MAVLQDHPYGNAQYIVNIPGFPQAQAFDEVLLPELLVDAEEIREGSDRSRSSRKIPGLLRYTNLVLRRGFVGSLDLYNWWKVTAEGNANARQNVTINLLSEDSTNVAVTWKLTGAFPVRYTFSPLNGLDGSPLIETLEACCDSVAME